MFTVAVDDLAGEDVLGLLAQHLGLMQTWSPAGKVHAFDADKLKAADVTFFAARVEGELAAIGALKTLDAHSGEIKSMRAADAWRGRGAGKAVLAALLAEARARGFRWVGLETGRHEGFIAAHELYRAHGFAECPPFAKYVSDDFSLCMRLDLA